MTSSLRKLYSHLSRRRRWQLMGLLLLMVVGAGAEMATVGAVVPFLTLLVEPDWADRYPMLRDLLGDTAVAGQGMLAWAAAAFATIAVAAAAVRLLLYHVSYRFTFGLGADISGELYRRTLHRPYSWHVARNSSDIVAAIEKVNSVTNSIIVQLVQGGVALLIGVAILATLLFIDARTAAVAGAFFSLLYAATTLFSRRRLRRNAQVIARNRTNRVRAVQEGLGGIRDVLLDGLQRVYHKRFASYDTEMRRAQASNAFIAAYPRVFMEAAGVVLIMILAYFMSGQPGGIVQAVPVLGALALGAQKLLPQMQQVYHAWTAITGNRGELDDVLALLDVPVTPAEPSPVGLVPSPLLDRPLLAFRNMSFRYHPDGPLVLSAIDLEVPRGMSVGIVGTTGCGKSTLVDIMMALLPPSGGSMEIDGRVLTPQTVRAWQSRIAHVPQAIYLTDASIAENIALGTPLAQIDPGRLQEAIRQAQLAPFVASLPERHLTPVGERGVRLSGGQRQRIGLARALYKQTDVLILDEATSALDSRTEQAVMTALDESPATRTSFIIAHRLTTVQKCDRIVVLDKGAIVGFDTWDDLAERNAVFRQLATLGRTAPEGPGGLEDPRDDPQDVEIAALRSSKGAAG